ncbi:MAG TPA: ABC transporter substrate-binding protein [Candidatus Butyricicoccus avicola]|nr:ABC transporter substrate-binding protein [Candidatus Butyricicoccus avicola]
MKKKTIAMVLAALAAMASLTACSGGQTASSGTDGGEDGTYTIGVVQYATHPSLDNCYEGFLKGLADEGFVEGENLTIDFQNAQGDTANCDLMAKTMVTSRVDLLAGIATPAVMSEYSAAKSSDIPIVFTAVSDPVSAGLVQSIEQPGSNCTGTSDVLPLEKQVKMIRAFLPDATKIGVIYTTSEPNSVSHLEKLQGIAADNGFEVIAVGVTNSSEVASAAASVVAQGADCINNFTDNNVVDNLSAVIKAANDGGIPVFGSEIEQVKNGCLASESIDYVALGEQTGRMAARILSGEDASTMPVEEVEDATPVYNSEVLEALGLTLPADYQDAQDVSAA